MIKLTQTIPGHMGIKMGKGITGYSIAAPRDKLKLFLNCKKRKRK